MPASLTDTLTGVTTTGAKPPATLTKWPELGATAQVALSPSGVSATVRLVASIIPGKWETLGTFTLPVPVGEVGAGLTYDAMPVFSTWAAWRWEVDSVNDAGGLTLSLQGVGI